MAQTRHFCVQLSCKIELPEVERLKRRERESSYNTDSHSELFGWNERKCPDINNIFSTSGECLEETAFKASTESCLEFRSHLMKPENVWKDILWSWWLFIWTVWPESKALAIAQTNFNSQLMSMVMLTIQNWCYNSKLFTWALLHFKKWSGVIFWMMFFGQ